MAVIVTSIVFGIIVVYIGVQIYRSNRAGRRSAASHRNEGDADYLDDDTIPPGRSEIRGGLSI